MITHNIRQRIRPSGIFASVAAVLLLVAVSYVYFLLAGRIHGTDYYVNGVSPTNDSLRIHAYLPKGTYVLGEDILLHIYLVNCSQRALCVAREPYISDLFLRTICRDTYGSELRETGIFRCYTIAYPLSCDSLAIGDSILVIKNLNAIYRSNRRSEAKRKDHPTGLYTVRAAFVQDSYSDEVQYRVVEPVSDDTLVH